MLNVTSFVNASFHLLGLLVSFWNPFTWLQWKPTSMLQLAQVEQRILQCLRSPLESLFVRLPQSQHRIRTVILNKQHEGTPLVMVHGMGGGIGLWAQSLDFLCQRRPLYAFDLLGFGRSSRPSFSNNPHIAETEFVESIEEWREQMKLEKVILLGHSLGAYIASSYALKYPNRVHHLVLVDSWGFPERPHDANVTQRRRIPAWIRAIATLLIPFNPLSAIRAAGPWGPGLVKRFRPDLQVKFSGLFDDDTIFDYIYHCNAQTPSGEVAFKAMQIPFGWAKNPMILRVGEIDKKIPITMVHGSRSWIDSQSAYDVKYIRNDSYVDVQVIRGAGHHVYADKPDPFNELIQKVCAKEDEKLKSAGGIDRIPSVSTLVEEQEPGAEEEEPVITQM